MKKLQLLMMALLSTAIARADLDFTGYQRLGHVAAPRRTEQQKNAYKDSKLEKGEKMQTPEFRFALKYAEYYEKMLKGKMTLVAFIEEVSRKVANYLKNKEHHPDHAEKAAFLNEYLSLPLEELKDRVGTIEEEGTMKRFID